MFSVTQVGRRKRLNQPPTRSRVCAGGAESWDAVVLVEMSLRKSFVPKTDSSSIHPRAKQSKCHVVLSLLLLLLWGGGSRQRPVMEAHPMHSFLTV
mmetsp:Transcript_10208/g.16706  ORF Transcript_10208/g.16706 Transcript_10208/m.16706 type:complete len:96 (+) Transcript_10208:247-534(+)